MGVWKNDQKSIVDECASLVTFFIQALSLELAGERRRYAHYQYKNVTNLI